MTVTFLLTILWSLLQMLFFLIESKQDLFTYYRNIPLNDLSILTLVTKLLKCKIASWSSDYFCRYFLILHYLFECVKIICLYVCCGYFQISLIMQANEVTVQGALKFKPLMFNANRTHKLQYELSAEIIQLSKYFFHSLSFTKQLAGKKPTTNQNFFL